MAIDNDLQERKFDVVEVAFALGLRPSTVYSYFKTQKDKIRDPEKVSTGLTYDQLLRAIDSRLAGRLGAKEKPLSKTEIKDVRYIISQRQKDLKQIYQLDFDLEV